MDIKQLKYFIEIANTRNLSQAARNLFVTQPTLSFTLKKMEAELNTRLFDQHDKSYNLTQSGKLLYNRGEKIVNDFDTLVNRIQHMKSDSKEVIRLGLTILFAVQYMQQISSFIATHQNVDLIITQNGSRKIQEMLASDELDIGLVSFPNTQSNAISIEALNTSTKGYNVHVVVPESNPLSFKEEVTFEDLKEQRFSTLNENFMLGQMLLDRSRHLGFEPHIVMQHDDLQVLLYSLKSLDSICLLPIEYKAIGALDGLKWIPLQDKNDYYAIGVALKKSKAPTKAINDLIAEIKKN
ncbi:DNA-binding transcriptional regulator, LysR family [Alkalibacterium subtropicum]|uniref:DNA-binding transcriptional regulator, LysR family n=1 Tax=Alkalibacterium subtropicum TaxID=753702 RepID=A0A1I1IHJ5_9LACT|nr:LysR family transcriptional regulator [Alkalibacterium subtropicum]SFC32700.1 DNA-binding transcriptional regulator, LysR family [Alkalibacterium subtropicum]